MIKEYYVYTLLCRDGSKYVGVTGHLEERMVTHFGSNLYPRLSDGKPNRVVSILDIEVFEDEKLSLNREKELSLEYGIKYRKSCPNRGESQRGKKKYPKGLRK